MNTILEALRELSKLTEDTPTDKYPTKCVSFAYRLIAESTKLVSGSFVNPKRLTYPALGVNINFQYYGRGTMANAKKALSFLTLEDAEAFCRKYNISQYYQYISKSPGTLVRIDNNTDVPTYMLEDILLMNTNKLNAAQRANLYSEIQSADNIVSDEIREKNKTRNQKLDIVTAARTAIDEVNEYLDNLPPTNVTLDNNAGNISIQFRLVSSDASIVNPKYSLSCKLSGNSLPKKNTVPESRYSILVETPPLDETMSKSIYDAFINKYQTKFNIKARYVFWGLNSDMVELERGYKNSLRCALKTILRLYNFDLVKLYKAFTSTDLFKQHFKAKIDASLLLVIADLKMAFQLKDDLEKQLEATSATKKVTVGYDDF